MAYAVVLCLCVREHRRIRSGLRLARPMLWLAGLAVCSTLWSQVPLSSLRYGIYYSLDTLLAIYLVTTFTLEELMDLVRMAGVTVVVCSAVMVAVFPQYGIVHTADHAGVWQGIFSEKNDAAKNLVFLLTPVMGSQVLRPRNLLYAALLLPFIAMTGSKSALVALLAMGAFAAGLAVLRRMGRRTAAFAATAAGVTLAAAATGLAAFWAQITALLGRDGTLTGRTTIWAHLLDSGMQRPWLGYGYRAFWTGLEGESGKLYMEVGWVFTYAHNGLLEVWLQVGWVGLALVLCALAVALRNAARCARARATEGTEWLVMLLALTLIYNLDEGTILFTRSLVSMLLVVTYAGLARAAAQEPAAAFGLERLRRPGWATGRLAGRARYA
jgi:O-antigen ligase